MFSKKCKVLSTVLLLLVNTAGQEYASSPCPSVFRYEFNGVENYGIIELPAPPLGTTITLKLAMSIKSRLPSRYVGKIEMLGGNDLILQQVLNGLNLQYKVTFPLPSPLPKVTSIVYNGGEYCPGPPENFDGPSQYVTSINLDHKLATGNTAGGQLPAAAPVSTDRPRYPPDYLYNQDINQVNPQQNYYQNNNYQKNPNDQYLFQYRPTNNNNNFYSEDQFNSLRPVDNGQQFSNPAPAVPTPTVAVQPTTTLQNTRFLQCGTGRADNFLVVKGMETHPGDWPWLTALLTVKTSTPVFTCGATLISSKHVVTAGHCVSRQGRPQSVNDLLLGFGGFRLFDFSETRTPLQIMLHPSYSTTPLKADIAVLIVADVTFTTTVKPACLWQGDNSLSAVVGQTGTLVGWGRDGSGTVHTNEPLMLEVPIVSTDTCRAAHSDFHFLTSDTTLCAGKRDGSSPCNGDSGGGLYVQQNGFWALRGIVSVSLKDRNTNFCDTSQFVVYTDAAKYMPWVSQIIGS